MESFSFQTTRSVLAEIGATADRLFWQTRAVSRFRHRRGILKRGLADEALDGIRSAGMDVWTFSAVSPTRPRR